MIFLLFLYNSTDSADTLIFVPFFSNTNDSLNQHYTITLGTTLKTLQCPFFNRDVKPPIVIPKDT